MVERQRGNTRRQVADAGESLLRFVIPEIHGTVTRQDLLGERENGWLRWVDGEGVHGEDSSVVGYGFAMAFETVGFEGLR